MHSKFFLAAQVILSFSLSAQAASISVKMSDGRMGSSSVESTAAIFKKADEKALRQYVDQNVQQIKQIARTNWPAGKKLQAIEERVKLVNDYRSQNWSKSAKTELDMDLQIKPYESFPKAQGFKIQRCGEYQNRVLVDWDPQAADSRKVSENGVRTALQVLQRICSG